MDDIATVEAHEDGHADRDVNLICSHECLGGFVCRVAHFPPPLMRRDIEYQSRMVGRPGDRGEGNHGPDKRAEKRHCREQKSGRDPIDPVAAARYRRRASLKRAAAAARAPHTEPQQNCDDEADEDRDRQSEPGQRQYRLRTRSGRVQITQRRGHAGFTPSSALHSRSRQRMVTHRKSAIPGTHMRVPPSC